MYPGSLVNSFIKLHCVDGLNVFSNCLSVYVIHDLFDPLH